MLQPDDLPMQKTNQDSPRALSAERRQLLWADLQGHVTASHIFETLGDTKLVAKHLQAATRLLFEIHS